MKRRRLIRATYGRRVVSIEATFGCPTGKIGYPTKPKAKRAAKEKTPVGQSEMRVYLCELCSEYHVTHTRRRERG